MFDWVLYTSNIYRYTVQVQEIFLVSLRFALKTSVELLSLISRGSISHNILFKDMKDCLAM